MIKTLKPLHAISIACIGMWLLSCVGVFLVVHFGNWWFFLSSESTMANWLQFGGFYGAYFAVRIPAVYFAALVVSKAEFRHRAQVLARVVASVEAFRLGTQLFRGPWLSLNLKDWWMPLVLDVSSAALLVMLGGVFIRLLNTDDSSPKFAEQN